MEQAHYVNGVSVVSVEGLSRKELFDGMKDWKNSTEMRASQDKIIRRLQKWIPDFVDETVQPGNLQCPNIFYDTNYDIQFKNGRVNANVEISDDLGKRLLEKGLIGDIKENEKRKEIADLFNGKSGVVIRANYHWNGNEGKGLQLGRFNKGCWFAINDYTIAFKKVINVLCQGVDLTEEVLCAKKSQFSGPLLYCDGISDIEALVRDVSLDAVRKADQPVGEFMAWMQENAAQVNTMGELVRLAMHSYLVAQEHEERAKAGRVVTTLPEIVKKAGNQYLNLAKEVFAQLQPPQNNRMDYLVH